MNDEGLRQKLSPSYTNDCCVGLGTGANLLLDPAPNCGVLGLKGSHRCSVLVQRLNLLIMQALLLMRLGELRVS
jgi:hypothetical protein